MRRFAGRDQGRFPPGPRTVRRRATAPHHPPSEPAYRPAGLCRRWRQEPLTVGLVGQRLPGPAHVRHYRDPTGARGPQHGRHRGRPHPTAGWNQRCDRVPSVLFDGRATAWHSQQSCTVPERTTTDTTSSRELRRSPSSQVTAAPDLALGAGDQFVEACVGLAVPAGRSVPGRGGPERRRRPRPDGSGAHRYTLGTRAAGK
jgi:hypothetical protein